MRGVDTRIGDREREWAVGVLGRHYRAGRLSVEELEDRVGRAEQASTRAQLGLLLADLPLDTAHLRRRAKRGIALAGWYAHLGAYGSASTGFWTIWLVAGAGEPWPLVPMAAWGILLLRHRLALRRVLRRSRSRHALIAG